ncbi:MAG TPA: hypothetical protein PLI27_02305 [Ignavibacteriales bacterium]|nr:hypothetical protein [Ignavibacteriales bacterium]HOL81646.1 hypothetical protein [Ignavibacteriales bacterium]HOM65173.1 hypothetical protein [Ignavibacteriales bacterium]HPD66897.1 hypothetical protein [Ignavibacteriales bacterium]HPP33760.1 hypothetical protein [Ignavibacteriales bacterium]
MFYLLLFSSLITGILVTFITIKIFRGTIKSLIQKIIELDIYEEWLKYITFVMYIIGVSSTFKINELAKYSDSYFQQNIFQVEKLVLNLVGTTINVLQSLAWILFLFYIALLVIIVIFKISANRK